jgi:hypothetical protein
LIDTPNAAIFHVFNDGSQTHVHQTTLRSERFAICVDLGTRASDIVQSNAVIWVEGPSDRIYLQYWLNSLAPDLTEGIHYSIMFYGGRLLSHLSANDDELNEFIGLRSLNQNLAIVIDSDRRSEDDVINKTKLRVASEFSKGASVAWITAGREIENYIEHTVLQTAVKTIHSENYDQPVTSGQFDHALRYAHKDKVSVVEKGIDKVKVAREVCKAAPNFDVMDLRERLEELHKMIRKANGS